MTVTCRHLSRSCSAPSNYYLSAISFTKRWYLFGTLSLPCLSSTKTTGSRLSVIFLHSCIIGGTSTCRVSAWSQFLTSFSSRATCSLSNTTASLSSKWPSRTTSSCPRTRCLSNAPVRTSLTTRYETLSSCKTSTEFWMKKTWHLSSSLICF